MVHTLLSHAVVKQYLESQSSSQQTAMVYNPQSPTFLKFLAQNPVGSTGCKKQRARRAKVLRELEHWDEYELNKPVYYMEAFTMRQHRNSGEPPLA